MLKIIIAKLEDVPEELQQYYKQRKKVEGEEKDERFWLQATAVDGFTIDNPTALKTTISTLRGEITTAKDAAKVWDGVDVKEAKEAIEKVKKFGDLTDGEEKQKAALEEAKKQYLVKHEAETAGNKIKFETDLKSERTRGDALETQLRDRMVRTEGLMAINELKGNAKLLLPMITERAKMVPDAEGSNTMRVSVHDINGTERLSTEGGNTSPMTIAEFVQEMKSDAEYAGAFEGTGASGGGTKAGAPGGGKSGGGEGFDPKADGLANLSAAFAGGGSKKK